MNEDKNKYSFLTLVAKLTNERLVLNNVLFNNLGIQHTIIETVVVGHEGTVKEEITATDWDINFEISILNDGQNEDVTAYPFEEVHAVLNYLKKNKSVTVISDFLAVANIHDIVIKNASLGQSTHSNQQTIVVSAISDTEFEMILNE